MKKMKTTSYELNMIRPDLAPGRVRLAFLTDLHNAENGSHNETLIHAIKEAQPDLILCGGDMLIGKKNAPSNVARDLLITLAEEYPIYHALGNHEDRLKTYPHQYGPIYREYRDALEHAGIIFLDNESELLSIRGIPLQIAGLSICQKYYKRMKRYHLDASEILEHLGAPNAHAINIMLAHHPNYMDSYVNWGADLTICGHYHGGLMRIGKTTGLLTPNLKLLNERCCGIFDFHARIRQGVPVMHDSHVIISAGLGEHTLPIRIHNPRELVIVDLNVIKKNPEEE